MSSYVREIPPCQDKPDLAEEGDSRYLAEEVLNSYPTKASDIFSLGAIILEVGTIGYFN